jgi:Transposase IS66 family
MRAPITLPSAANERSGLGWVKLGERVIRQEQSASLVADLEAWMRIERAKLSRSNDVAKAMEYMLKRWSAFTRCLDDGRICLSNNGADEPYCPSVSRCELNHYGEPKAVGSSYRKKHHALHARNCIERFMEDGSRFEFDYQKLAAETGCSLDDLRSPRRRCHG